MGGLSSEAFSPTALAGPLASRRSLLKAGQSAAMGLPLESAARDTRVRHDLVRHFATGRTMESIEAERNGTRASIAGQYGPQIAATVLSYVFPPVGLAMKAGLAVGDQVDRSVWADSRSSAAGLQQGLQPNQG